MVELKFKVDDRVRVRAWESMADEYGVDKVGRIEGPKTAGFYVVSSMRKLCGNPVTILKVQAGRYYLASDGGPTDYNIEDWMLEPERMPTYKELETSLSELSARYVEACDRADGLARKSEKDKEFVEKMFSACVYLDKAVPVFGRDNAERVRFATDEIIRLRAQLQAVAGERDGLLPDATMLRQIVGLKGFLELTMKIEQCPDNYDRACLCALCRSYVDMDPTQEGGGGG